MLFNVAHSTPLGFFYTVPGPVDSLPPSGEENWIILALGYPLDFNETILDMTHRPEEFIMYDSLDLPLDHTML